MNEFGRRKFRGKCFTVNVGTTLPELIFCEVEEFAKRHGITNARVIRELSLRGLAPYHRDGKLGAFAEDSNGSAESLTPFNG